MSSCIPLEVHLTPTSFVLFYPLESLINFFCLRYNSKAFQFSKSTKLITEAFFQRIVRLDFTVVRSHISCIMSAACNPTILQELCTLDTCCLSEQAYLQYLPTVAGNAAYAAIFGVILVAQTGLLIAYPKTWGFYIGIAACLILEIVGYIGRILLHNNPFSLNNFVIYLVPLTIGPAFMMAAIYLMMGRVVVAYGSHHSLVKPVYYSAICIAWDLASLILQAAGGAIAATGDDHAATVTGSHIMVAGLSVQLVSTIIFVVICVYFFNNVLRNKTDRNSAFAGVTSSWRFKGMLAAVVVATTTIFIRSAFRVDELKDGFDSSVANNEVLFMVFEGPMLIVAGIVLTIFHPGFGFQGTYGDANYKLGKAKKSVKSTSSLELESGTSSERK